MKFKIEKINQIRFKPVKVEIRLEEPNDLFCLAAALNLSAGQIKNQSAYLESTAYENPESKYSLFCKLDEMAMDWIAHCEAAKVEPNPGYSNLLDKKE